MIMRLISPSWTISISRQRTNRLSTWDNQLRDSESFEDEQGNNPFTRKSGSKSTTPVLDNYGRDVTRLAEEGKLDPIVGVNRRLRVSQIPSRRKNNPILIGEPGVGKTAIVEGLALRIMQKRVSRTLLTKELWCWIWLPW